MKLLDLIIKEYISIVEILNQDNPIESDRIIIEREYFKELLEKYNYLTFSQKTKVYKALNLLIHDNNNYTMPYRDTQTKKTVRKVIINYGTYRILKHLFDTEVNI